MGIDVQVGDSSVALHKTLIVAGHVTIHYHSNLVSTFQLLVWHTVTGVTGGDYSEAIRSISSKVLNGLLTPTLSFT